MKKYKYSLILLSFILFLSCEKETEGISRVTEYPVLEMQGDNMIFVVVNTAFTDPGVKAYIGDEETDVQVIGNVDTSTSGVYALQYVAKNEEGFGASVTRNVAVVESLPTKDLSGTYQIIHSTRSNRISISKINGMIGYYRASDTWFQDYPIAVDFVDLGDGTIKVLSGSSVFGGHFGIGNYTEDGVINFQITLTDQGPYTYKTSYSLVQ